MPSIPTIEDVARLSKTSRSTVSRVINNQDGVSEKAKQRVLEAVATLNYQPNRHARGLVTGETGAIGVAVPRAVTQFSADSFIAPIIDGIYKIAHGGTYSVTLWIIDTMTDSQWLEQHLMNSRQVDGVVMIPSPESASLFASLIHIGLPCITIGRFNGQEEYYVDIDNRAGAKLAVTHLIKLGYQRIATILGRQTEMVGRDRFEGYKQALAEAGLPFDPSLVIDGDFHEETAYNAIKAKPRPSFDAIFAANDSMAIGAIHALQENGYSVPGDVGVVGFDDVARARTGRPPLTTIRQPLYDFGQVATQLLVEQMRTQGASGHRSILLPIELVVRESCGANLRRG